MNLVNDTKGEPMEIANICEYCEEHNCMHCYLGNPCIGCMDYDEDTDTCKSYCEQRCYLNPCIVCTDYDEDTDTCRSDGGCRGGEV